ncbi:hypothetical protein BJY01DRAFT_74953 [Aspergillus pseudoustus]|uniref:Uncharacterized protein n=1 Tax=Aspergillus pseudoustus TaxID=1810923 RepID=A0ABR4KQ70_9EURO
MTGQDRTPTFMVRAGVCDLVSERRHPQTLLEPTMGTIQSRLRRIQRGKLVTLQMHLSAKVISVQIAMVLEASLTPSTATIQHDLGDKANCRRWKGQRLSSIRREKKREEVGGTVVGGKNSGPTECGRAKAAVGTGWSPRNQTQGEPRTTRSAETPSADAAESL